MPLTKKERDLLAALSEKAKAEEEAEAGYELWIKTMDGNETKLTGAKAKAYARKHGLEDDEPEDEDDEDGDDEGRTPKDAKPESTSFFKGKK
jgi:hypothetical protein